MEDIATELYTSGYLSVDPGRLDLEDMKNFLIGAPIDEQYRQLSFLEGVTMTDECFGQSCPPQIIYTLISGTDQFRMRVETYIDDDYQLQHEETISKETMLQQLDELKEIFPLIDVQNNVS